MIIPFKLQPLHHNIGADGYAIRRASEVQG